MNKFTTEEKRTYSESPSLLHADEFTFHQDGSVTARSSFFYSNDARLSKMIDAIHSRGWEILDEGKIWKPFKGGAPMKNQSHYYVKFQKGHSTS